jgi:hypothetical protein
VGYEHYDAHLRRLGQAVFIALASARPQREVVSDLLHLRGRHVCGPRGRLGGRLKIPGKSPVDG